MVLIEIYLYMLRKRLLGGLMVTCALFATVSQASADSCQPTSGAPSGTVTYNGQTITVTSGTFTLNGITGTIDNGGYVSYNGYTGCLTNIPGVTGYQVTGQQAQTLTPVFTGTVTYGAQSVTVTNGAFTFNGKAGTITSSGSDWVVTYDGKSAKINAIDCLTSYRLDGQSMVTTGKAMCSTGGTDLTSWANAHGGLQKNRGANWQEFSPNVSQYQVDDWLVNNPSLTPMQVFESMKANQVKFLTISLAWKRAGSRGALYDFNFANPPVTTKMLYNAGLIEIPKYRTLDSLSYIFSGDNVREAAIYGLLTIGVSQADKCRLDGSVGTNESISFSQNDLNLAQQYRNNGYWGPNDTGNIQWEIQKLGITKARLDYTSTGPNIATANDCKITIPTNTCPLYQIPVMQCASDEESVPTKDSKGCVTGSVCQKKNSSCSNFYWFDNTTRSCGQKQFCGTYVYAGLQTFPTQSACQTALTSSSGSTSGSGTSVDNEDTTVVDESCTDLTYYMSISLTRSPSATAYTRSQSTDAITDGQVTELQTFLKDQGFMDQSVTTTGRYGSMTTRAVKVFQARYGFSQTGATGPMTRAKIKALTCN